MTRLFHQALTDELLLGRHQPTDEASLLDGILEEARRADWATDYARDHAAEHAVAAGRLDHLLDDTRYLVAVNPARLVPHLGAAHTTAGRVTATTYRQAAHLLTDPDPAARASQLELIAHQLGHGELATGIAAAAPDRPWQTRSATTG